MKARRIRVVDSTGKPVKGLYSRRNGDGSTTYYSGHQHNGRWQVQALDAHDLTSARKARESLLAGLREGRIVERTRGSMDDLFTFWLATKSCSDRSIRNYRHLWSRHAGDLRDMEVQAVTTDHIAARFREMTNDGYSPWTRSHVRGILNGMFAMAVNGRGPVPIRANPLDALTREERPTQQNERKIHALDLAGIEMLVVSGTNERWRAALALAGHCGLRLGEIRALRWGDLMDEEDRIGNSIYVSASALPDGTLKETKTEAGERTVPLLPQARKLLAEWKLKSAHSDADDFVIATRGGDVTEERNMRRALDSAIAASGIVVPDDDRLSWHSLRHSAASVWVTEFRWPVTSVAKYLGHRDATTTLALYARDSRSVTEGIERDLAAVATA